MPMIDAEGCRICVEIDGAVTAPALILSNSLGANLHMWDEQAKALSKNFRVIRYDQRGHGKSDAPKGPYTIRHLGKDVIAILDSLKIERAHFCGLSMGGTTGMWLGCFAANRFNKLVLSNTGARIGDPAIWNARIQTVLAKGMAAIVDSTLERWFSQAFRESNKRAVSAVRKMLLTTPAHGYAGCSAAIRDADQRWDIAGIKLPTLVITGTLDPATPAKDGEFIASHIKGSKLVALEAAHLSNLEKPQQYIDALEKFLA